jgi:hypothetical protein
VSVPVAVADAGLYLRDLELRIPFTFGVTTLEAVPHALLRVEADVDGERTAGVAAGHLVPRWFTKATETPVAGELESLVEVCEHAADHAAGAETDSAFEWWEDVYARQREWAAGTDHPPLLWGLGVSLVERAVVDAVCRATGRPFRTALLTGTLGFVPGAVHDELAGADPAALLPDSPSRSVGVRHTVGYTDPLAADGDDARDDGLPWTLAEVIDAYGVDHFKLKLTGDVDADADRLRDVTAVVDERVPAPAYTVDANEQYDSVARLRELRGVIEADDALAGLREGLLFVEQPFPRATALSADVGEALTAWDGPPVVIDESDATPASLPTALSRGYAGTSHKNCKGVFKGVANACLLERRRREGEAVFLTGEDLSTVGPVGLQQDLAVVATLGLDHAERNGHHYFRGLDGFPGTVGEQVLDAHPDLYRRHPDGFATLAVEDGRVSTESVLSAPFGAGTGIPTDPSPMGFVPAAEWSFDAGG